MIPEIQEINFPSYATLSQATVTLQEMGDRTITAKVKIDGDIIPDFSFDWEVRFKGERFIHPLREPQAAKENTSRRSVIDMVFHNWAVYQLKRYYFMEMASVNAGTAIADKYNASLGLTLPDFVVAFNKVLNYYFGDQVKMVLNPYPEKPYDDEPRFVEINYSHIWDVLQQIKEIYDVRWTMRYAAGNDTYEIRVGYKDEQELDHIFEYGYEGGLLKFQRSVQDNSIANVLLGRGGEKNLPVWYFKNPELFTEGGDNELFQPDPDAIPELRFVQFTELRGWVFRMYVRGWKTNRNRILKLYKNDGSVLWSGTPDPVDAALYASNWAYRKGCDDAKFNPPEYVKSESSIAKYGEVWGALENKEDIYPSIKGVTVEPYGRIDEVVDVEEVKTDDMSAVAAASTEVSLPGVSLSTHIKKQGTYTDHQEFEQWGGSAAKFTIPDGMKGSVDFNFFVQCNDASVIVDTEESKIMIRDSAGNVLYSPGILSSGTYYIGFKMYVRQPKDKDKNIVLGIQNVKLTYSDTANEAWKPTFDIWVKNIWDTVQMPGESDDDYIQRVWLPILGQNGQEAAVTFYTGALSGHEDWEFIIVGNLFNGVHLDKTKSINGVQSHWRLTLQKSDAELDASGKYIPYVNYNAHAGDFFFFTGIDMPYSYVYWAEQRLDTYKTEQLDDKAHISPTWDITLDKVRTNESDPEFGGRLVDRLYTGALVNIRDKRFTGDSVLQLYIEGLTYTWNENATYPDVKITLSDKIYAVKSTSQQLSSQIQTLQREYVSLKTVEDAVTTIMSRGFLAKTASSDTSFTETEFVKPIKSSNFEQGRTGGSGWGAYRDWDNMSVLEADRVIVRHKLDVNELVVNQISAIGGKQIISAASIECSSVEDLDGIYRCHFDQKRGSVSNQFAVGDIAMGQRFDLGNTDSRYYKYKVVAVGSDYIDLDKNTCSEGADAPQMGDVIVQMGSFTADDRQGAHIIASYGTNSPSYVIFAGVNSFDTTRKDIFGVEFKNKEPFFFNYGSMLLGDRDKTGSYIEYDKANKKLNIKATVNFLAGSTGLSNIAEWTALTTKVDNMQDQIDGAIETWYASGVPTLSNVPAKDWDTDKKKNDHIGDLYFNKDTGKAYRFVLDSDDKAYKWIIITDIEISDALAKANEALEKANASIKGVDVEFALSDSPTVAPTEGWSTTAPERVANQYLWQRVATTLANGSVTYGDVTCISGKDGKGIKSIIELFYLTAATSVQKPSYPVTETKKVRGQWTKTCPDWEEGYAFWTCTQLEYEDGTFEWTDPVQAGNIKNHTYYTQEGQHPMPPYNAGDYWVCAHYADPGVEAAIASEDDADAVVDGDIMTMDANAVEYTNELLVCIASKPIGNEFSINDWTPVGDYAKNSDYEYLKAAMPRTNAVIDGGLVLGSFLGVTDAESGSVTEGSIVAGMAGIKGEHNEFFEYADSSSELHKQHADRKLLIFAGAPSDVPDEEMYEKYRSSKTQIWSDGFLKTDYAKIGDFWINESGIFDDGGNVKISVNESTFTNVQMSGSLQTQLKTNEQRFIALADSQGRPIVRLNSSVLENGISKTMMYLAKGSTLVNEHPKNVRLEWSTSRTYRYSVLERVTAAADGTLTIPQFTLRRKISGVVDNHRFHYAFEMYDNGVYTKHFENTVGDTNSTVAINIPSIEAKAGHTYALYFRIYYGELRDTWFNEAYAVFSVSENTYGYIQYSDANTEKGAFMGLNGLDVCMGGSNRLRLLSASNYHNSYDLAIDEYGQIKYDYRRTGGRFEAIVTADGSGTSTDPVPNGELGIQLIGYYDSNGQHLSNYPAFRINLADGTGWHKLKIAGKYLMIE